MADRVAVVVAAWGETPAERSFAGLAPQLGPAIGSPWEGVIVFNGPQRPEVTAAGRNMTRTATLSENVGVARGWNVGWQLTTAEVVCFLNEDVRLQPAALRPVLEAVSRSSDIGVAGALGSTWDRAAMRHVTWVRPRPSEVLPCDVVSGFLLVVRRSLLRATGGFDERFSPCGGEEVDLCFAAAAAGLRVVVASAPGVEHEWGISSASRRTLVRWLGGEEALVDVADRNRRLLRAKWSAAAGTTPRAAATPPRFGALRRASVRARYAGAAALHRLRRARSR